MYSNLVVHAYQHYFVALATLKKYKNRKAQAPQFTGWDKDLKAISSGVTFLPFNTHALSFPYLSPLQKWQRGLVKLCILNCQLRINR